MWGRELIEAAIAGNSCEVNGFWVGHPSDEAKKIYYQETGITGNNGKSEADFNLKINSDMIWLSPELDPECWKSPDGSPMWNCFNEERKSLGSGGIFADCESIAEIEAFPWPDPAYMDFTNCLEDSRYAYEKGLAVFGGMWCPFFHVLCDFFGMENYFVKMYTDPEVVHAATRHIVDFYLEANRRYLWQAKPYLSAAFFGNDLGTQLSLLISPESFDEFVLPYLTEIVQGIKAEGLKTAMHSCGAIDLIIPKLIDSGIDILHPLQAKAAGMDAENLAAKYGGKLVFMGGVDTQELLPFGNGSQVKEEVLRLRDIFKGKFIVSPSHEALLPNVPFENVMAMSAGAKEESIFLSETQI